jgi:hypothetical protein
VEPRESAARETFSHAFSVIFIRFIAIFGHIIHQS